MTLQELVAAFEARRAEAARHQATAPVAAVYEVVLDDLRQLDGTSTGPRLMDTDEAAGVLGVSRRTVARRCIAGRFAGARKTSGDTGKWLIPATEVYAEVGKQKVTRPKLWEASG